MAGTASPIARLFRKGTLVTDWSACDERVKGLVAGQDLEMPDSGGFFLIVNREMLHARSHVSGLQAAYIRRRKLRRQVGIFRKISPGRVRAVRS